MCSWYLPSHTSHRALKNILKTPTCVNLFFAGRRVMIQSSKRCSLKYGKESQALKIWLCLLFNGVQLKNRFYPKSCAYFAATSIQYSYGSIRALLFYLSNFSSLGSQVSGNLYSHSVAQGA